MRIRSIKPEFWMSESIGRLSRDARLLFIGLWSFADDSGRGRGTFAAISGSLLPYDQDAMSIVPKLFSELEREGMVRRYIGEDGNTYFDIPKWLNHQKIERPSKSRIPPFTEVSPKPHRTIPEGSPQEQGAGNRYQGIKGNVYIPETLPGLAVENSGRPTERQKVLDAWNAIATKTGRPKKIKITDSLWKKYQARVKEGFTFEKITESMENLNDFAKTGGWLTFDWICDNENNWLKLAEGKYSEKSNEGLTPEEIELKAVAKRWGVE
jgi:hypothetical protein